jgi:hypothetical protein
MRSNPRLAALCRGPQRVRPRRGQAGGLPDQRVELLAARGTDPRERGGDDSRRR